MLYTPANAMMCRRRDKDVPPQVDDRAASESLV